MFVKEKTKKITFFTKVEQEIIFNDNCDKHASTCGQWNADEVASDRIKYQLMICDRSFLQKIPCFWLNKSILQKCNHCCVDYARQCSRTAVVTHQK